MKNKLKSLILIFFCFFLLCKSVNSNEPFVFDVTEIEILENGNQINGYKGGTATSKDGSIINAENFLKTSFFLDIHRWRTQKEIDEELKILDRTYQQVK